MDPSENISTPKVSPELPSELKATLDEFQSALISGWENTEDIESALIRITSSMVKTVQLLAKIIEPDIFANIEETSVSKDLSE